MGGDTRLAPHEATEIRATLETSGSVARALIAARLSAGAGLLGLEYDVCRRVGIPTLAKSMIALVRKNT
jgi:hypothetical protein